MQSLCPGALTGGEEDRSAIIITIIIIIIKIGQAQVQAKFVSFMFLFVYFGPDIVNAVIERLNDRLAGIGFCGPYG